LYFYILQGKKQFSMLINHIISLVGNIVDLRCYYPCV